MRYAVVSALLFSGVAALYAQPNANPFAVQSTLALSPTGLTILADVNGDGLADVITATADAFVIHLNDGSGNLLPARSFPLNKSDGMLLGFSFVVADFNRDGYSDIAAVTNLGIYLYAGDGKGNFSPGKRTSIQSDVRSLSAVTADFNYDGIPDIAAGVGGRGLKLYLGSGTGDFHELLDAFTAIVPQSPSPALSITDLNSDGFADLILVDIVPHTVSLLTNDGTGHFHALQVIQRDKYSQPESAIAGDFDRSGRPQIVLDILIANVSSNISFQQTLEFWKADDKGQFSLSSVIDTDAPRTVTAADLDGDGNLDISASGAGGTKLYFGNGTGGFPRVESVPAAQGTPFVTQFTDKIKPSLLVANNQSLSVLGTAKIGTHLLLTRDLPSPFNSSQNEFFTVTVQADALVPGFPVGVVTLTDTNSNGTVTLGTMTLMNGFARFALQLSSGQHTLQASYSGDSRFGPSSGTLTVAEAGQPAMVSTLNTLSFLGFTNLQVLVVDAFGNPVRGAGVLFTAPVQGPTGTFLGAPSALVLTNQYGIAQSPLFIRKGVAGSYQVTATVSGYPALVTTIPLTNP